MKRFSDTDLWDKEWFMELKPKIKCLVQFIFSKCDQAGVWSPNWTLASSFIGEKVSATDISKLKKHFEILSNGKIFVLDFVKFQYGELTEKCMPHRKVIALLKNHGLFERVLIGYQYPTSREQEEYKDKEEEEEEDKEEEGEKNLKTPKVKVTPIMFRDSPLFDFAVFTESFSGTDYEAYNLRYYYESVLNWSDGSLKKKIDWLATAKNFMLSDSKAGKAALQNVDLLKNNNGNRNFNNNKPPTGSAVDSVSAFEKLSRFNN